LFGVPNMTYTWKQPKPEKPHTGYHRVGYYTMPSTWIDTDNKVWGEPGALYTDENGMQSTRHVAPFAAPFTLYDWPWTDGWKPFQNA
jgi:hypothetical protein